MTEELNLLREALRRVKYEAASLADAQVIALEALTQRPAAQDEREAFEAWWESDGPNTSSPYDAAMSGWLASRKSLPAPQQATPGWSYAQVRVVDENTADIGRVVAFADEQKATPEPEHDMAGMLARGAKAWAGVDPQEIRAGGQATPEPVGEPHAVAVQAFGAMRASGASENYAVRRALDVAVAEWVKRAKANGLIEDTRPAPGVPCDAVRDAIASVREHYRGTDWGKAAECICDAIDAATLAAAQAKGADK